MKKHIILSVVVILIACMSPALAGQPAGRVIGWGDSAGGDLFGHFVGTNIYGLPTNNDCIGYATIMGQQLTNVVAIAAEGRRAMALREDGTVVMWGRYSDKKLLAVPPDVTNITAIALGDAHNLALKSDGTLLCWGDDASVAVPPGLSNVVTVAGGGPDTIALKRDGTIEKWGSRYGAPPAGLSNVVAIAMGMDNLVLREDGTVVEWPSYYASDTYNMPQDLSNVVPFPRVPLSLSLSRRTEPLWLGAIFPGIL